MSSRSATRRFFGSKLFVLVAAILGVTATAAVAFWTATVLYAPTNFAVAKADTLPQGTEPSAPTLGAPNANTVTVTFAQVSTSSSRTLTSYVVKRYPGGTDISSSCTFGPTTTCTDANLADGTYTYTDTPKIAGTSWTGSESAQSDPVTVDATAPTVSSIAAAATSPTNAASIAWTVTFSEPVTGVVAGEFSLANTGLTTPSISGVTGSGTTWTVTASTGSGSGSLGLNLADHDAIADAASNKLGGAGNGNGNFTGETYTIDRTAPNVTLTSVNGAARTFPYVTNSIGSMGGACTTSDGNVAVTVGSQNGSVACTSGAWTYTVATPITSEGAYTASASQTDPAGNPGTSGNRSITVDTTAPVVSLTSVNGTVRTFPYVTNANVSSIGGGCATGDGTVSVTLGSLAASAPCVSGSWSYTASPSISAQDTYGASATQTDAAGNAGDSGSKSITIDKTAPTVSLTEVNGAGRAFPYVTNTSITSVGGACATGDGNVSVTVGSQSGGVGCASNAWTFTLTTPISAEGLYSAMATQTDAASNTGSSGAKSITVDTTAPNVTVTRVNGTVRTFPYATNADVTSVGGGCTTGDGNVSVSIGNQSGSVACTSAAWTFTLPTAISAEGAYTASATQTDTAGNPGTDNEYVTIDKTAPAVTLTKVNGGSNLRTKDPVTSIGGACTTGDGNVAASISTQSGSVACASGGWTFTLATAITAEGSYSASATQTDAAGNLGSSGTKSVVVDKTGPTASAVADTNGGSTVGKPETSDTLVLTYSEAMDPASILAGWDGTSVSVTVRFKNNAVGTDDVVEVWNAANTTQLNVGSVNLGNGGYVTGDVNFTNSTAVLDAAGKITIALGTPSDTSRIGTVSGNGNRSKSVWTPSTAAKDLAGNAASSSTKDSANQLHF